MHENRVFTTIDAHAAGEPLRLITAGVPILPGDTILDRRAYLAAHHDDIRRALLFEPRGHADMYGAILTPPVSPDAHFGVIFLTNEGYSSMCGHGVIALTTILLERGMLERAGTETEVVFDSPAGLIRARSTIDDGRVASVAFTNVPAFRYARGVDLEISIGPVRVDIVYGGAFYALIDAEALGVEVVPANTPRLVALGMEIKRAIDGQMDVAHPEEPRLRGMYGTIISDSPHCAGADGRNITIYAEGAVDRSPCGTGTSARLAALFADERIRLNEPYIHESVIGTTFTGRILAETAVGEYPAVITEVSGQGFLTGAHQFIIDPDDPTAGGFLVR